MNDKPLPTFYRVELTATGQPTCQCENCQLWTIAYVDGAEPTEIGTAWQGADGREAADNICDLMNMAFEKGTEQAGEAQYAASMASFSGRRP